MEIGVEAFLSFWVKVLVYWQKFRPFALVLILLCISVDIAFQEGYSNLIVELYCLSVVNLLNSSHFEPDHHYFALISLWRLKFGILDHSQVLHIHREGNFCANIFAKSTSQDSFNIVVFHRMFVSLSLSF